jgi:LPS sulfotransferase NodH
MDEFPFLSGRSADRWFLSEYARLLPGEAYASAAETPFKRVDKKFVIAFTPRVGSTLLCQNLFKYGVFVAEFFNPLHLEAATHTPQVSDCGALCTNLVERYALNGAWGLKAHVQSMVPLFLAAEFPANIKDWRFVYLSRDNVVRQAISQVIAEIRQSWSSWNETKRKVTDADYSHAAIAQAILSNRLSKESWETFFALYGIEPLRLAYEQIVADPAAAAARVAAHCGLEPGGQERVQEFDDPPLKPQTTALNAAWESRFKQEAMIS